MAWQNIILTTGKTSVGRLLAMEMGREFLDMDIIIEEREQRPISQIFAVEGEAYFRQLEADLCRELSGQEGLIIATGGGTLVPEENLQVMANTGLVICLDCEPAVLWERIGHCQNRPMLAEEDETRFARLAALLEQRTPAYRRIKHHIDVTHLPKEGVAEKICHLLKSQN